jgi:O-acetyl-ADP-ribose deacetylase (regulator of RNase III)
MSLKIITGNIFTTNCQTIVNTVNCVGVMGAGLALEFRLRYPEMHDKYVDLCKQNMIKIGTLWIYKAPDRIILNFPTKTDWKYPSKLAYLEAGLSKFVQTYADKGITSIAFPMLGADKGGLSQELSLNTITQYLSKIPIDVEVYRYDPTALDDRYLQFKEWFESNDPGLLTTMLNMRSDFILKVSKALSDPNIRQLNQLAKVDGIGIKTLEKIYRSVDFSGTGAVNVESRQNDLFG